MLRISEAIFVHERYIALPRPLQWTLKLMTPRHDMTII